MRAEVAWLVEQLEGCTPREGLRSLAEARAAYAPLAEAARALKIGAGMLFGLSLSSCFEEARSALEPLLAARVRAWEQFLAARFGDDAVWEMRFQAGAEPSVPWWIERAERNLEQALARHHDRPGEPALVLEIEIISDRARVTGAALRALGTGDPIAPRPSESQPRFALRLAGAAELEALWRWAHRRAGGAARSPSPGPAIAPRLEVAVAESPLSFERAWWSGALGLSAMRPTGVLVQSWPRRFDRNWEPSTCRGAVELEGGAAQVALRFAVQDVEPREEQAIHDWAAALARSAGLAEHARAQPGVVSGLTCTESRFGRTPDARAPGSG
ncbi:MAG TPA: hypothetical protein VKZ63_21485 [Kofleriaceae bacterium]|nr:hypothetical protein [Kofleriaceae bacterium]